MEVTANQYKTQKLKHKRLWRDSLEEQGVEVSQEELDEMWKKFDPYTVVEPEPKQEIDWEKVRREKLRSRSAADLEQKKSTRETTTVRIGRKKQRKRSLR